VSEDVTDENRGLPAAVQFDPESIRTRQGCRGHAVISNVTGLAAHSVRREGGA
jgi:anthranilate/para-aminobenzoate synthase component II